jgi:hypothetical protein
MLGVKEAKWIESNWTYRIADHPPPITLFCHLLSPLNRFSSFWSFDSNSFCIICAFSSKDCAHAKSFVSQNGFAVKPSICSSDGSWHSPAGWGNSISPRALFDCCVLGMYWKKIQIFLHEKSPRTWYASKSLSLQY